MIDWRSIELYSRASMGLPSHLNIDGLLHSVCEAGITLLFARMGASSAGHGYIDRRSFPCRGVSDV